MAYIPMSQKELDRYEIIQKTIKKELTAKKASDLLYLTERQIYNLKAKVKQKGAVALIHGSRGRPSNRKLPGKERKKIANLLRKRYTGFHPTHAAEKLKDDQGICRDSKTIRKIMTEEGLWKPKKRRLSKYHSCRPRKEYYGEMEQFDGSYHDWFEGRAPSSCLLLAIDDATGIVTHASFAHDEGTIPVFNFWQEYFLRYGKPRSIYLDRLRTYYNNILPERDEEALTQFQRAMKELGVEPITAHSPQAKGRVERVFKTLQDRLVKEMRLAGISDERVADAYLKDEFLPWFNAKYMVQPTGKTDLHRKLSLAERKQLPVILSRQSKRVVQNDFTVRFNNAWYQIGKKQQVLVRPRDTVTLEERIDGTLHISLRDKSVNYQILPAKPEKQRIARPVPATQKLTGKSHKPPVDHPWRRFTINPKPEISKSLKT